MMKEVVFDPSPANHAVSSRDGNLTYWLSMITVVFKTGIVIPVLP